MITKPLRLTLAIGLLLGFTACQDDGPVAPDDVTPLFGVDCEKKPDHPQCTDPPPDPGGDPTFTLTLASAVIGGPQSELEDSGKLGVLGFTLTTAALTNFIDSHDNWLEECVLDGRRAVPEDGPMLAQALLGAAGTNTVVRVDTTAAKNGIPSENNRITVDDVDTEGVRSVQLGMSSLFPDEIPEVTDYIEDETTITFTMSGGVVRVRNRASPSRVVKLHCPYHGDGVQVTIARDPN